MGQACVSGPIGGGFQKGGFLKETEAKTDGGRREDSVVYTRSEVRVGSTHLLL